MYLGWLPPVVWAVKLLKVSPAKDKIYVYCQNMANIYITCGNGYALRVSAVADILKIY
jgi:hypothetical protein